MNVEPLPIDGVFRATPRHKGVRSFDWFRRDALASAVPTAWQPAVGSLQTLHRGEVDGLHLELGYRVLTCTTGRAALVVVDMRRGSGTFKRWVPVDLEPIDRPTIVVPPGTAWGCQGFSDVSVLLSLHEGRHPGPLIDPADPDLLVTWPLPAAAGGISFQNALARGDLPD